MKAEAIDRAIIALGLKIEALQAKLTPEQREVSEALNNAKSDLSRAQSKAFEVTQ